MSQSKAFNVPAEEFDEDCFYAIRDGLIEEATDLIVAVFVQHSAEVLLAGLKYTSWVPPPYRIGRQVRTCKIRRQE